MFFNQELTRGQTMALIKCQFFSEVLNINTSISVLIPEPNFSHPESMTNKFPTLFLLHGYSDDDSAWLRRTSIERYMEPYNLAVVMPQVDHSFYTDMHMGKKYWTYLTKELPFVVRTLFPLSDKREDNFVAGISMGGYGAFKWALHHPEQFAAAASLSGVLDIQSYRKKKPDRFRPIFRKGQCLADSDHDLLWLVNQVAIEKNKPCLYQSCGREDFLYQDNLRFYKTINETSFDVTIEFDLGNHDWVYWDKKIQKVLSWLPIPQKEKK
jgi:putative tributyrin esterase